MDGAVVNSLIMGKILAAFLIIWAVVLMVRTQDCIVLVDRLRRDPPILYAVDLGALIVGLVIVIAHPVWSLEWPVLITLAGWAIVVTALVDLLLPYKFINQLYEYFNKPSFYRLHSGFSFLIGLYLAVMTFGRVG